MHTPSLYWLTSKVIADPAGPYTVTELREMRPTLKGTAPKVCADGHDEWHNLAAVLGPAPADQSGWMVLAIVVVLVVIVGAAAAMPYFGRMAALAKEAREQDRKNAALAVQAEEARLRNRWPEEYERQVERRKLAEEITKALKK